MIKIDKNSLSQNHIITNYEEIAQAFACIIKSSNFQDDHNCNSDLVNVEDIKVIMEVLKENDSVDRYSITPYCKHDIDLDYENCKEGCNNE